MTFKNFSLQPPCGFDVKNFERADSWQGGREGGTQTYIISVLLPITRILMRDITTIQDKLEKYKTGREFLTPRSVLKPSNNMMRVLIELAPFAMSDGHYVDLLLPAHE